MTFRIVTDIFEDFLIGNVTKLNIFCIDCILKDTGSENRPPMKYLNMRDYYFFFCLLCQLFDAFNFFLKNYFISSFLIATGLYFFNSHRTLFFSFSFTCWTSLLYFKRIIFSIFNECSISWTSITRISWLIDNFFHAIPLYQSEMIWTDRSIKIVTNSQNWSRV